MTFTRKAIGAGAVGILAMSSLAGPALGSSHREAPMIAKDPTADITDLYAFVSPDRPSTVTIVANYIPVQEPAGGPNFYPFDDNVRYFISIDNTGDGVADIKYSFRFTTRFSNPDSFLYSGYGPIPAVEPNLSQTYDVYRNGDRIAQNLSVPADNIGPRTTPDYADYSETGIHNLGNSSGKVFAGQRDDPFYIDLGAIFDLGGLRPFNPLHIIPLREDKGVDTLSAFNVKSIAIQVPKRLLTNNGEDVSGPDSANAVVGIYAGAERQARAVLDGEGGLDTSGDWVQVSRIANPLINEVIIAIGEKDYWNASEPADDAQFRNRYRSPELAAIINTIYPSLPDARTSDRDDLVLILGQGVPGLNATNSGDTLYDLLRLNMGIPPTANPHRLGVLRGDLAGYPNGRRLADDITDISIRAVAEGYGSFLKESFGLPNKSPNNSLGDGCNRNDKRFLSSFPYAATAHSGYFGGDYRNRPCEP